MVDEVRKPPPTVAAAAAAAVVAREMTSVLQKQHSRKCRHNYTTYSFHSEKKLYCVLLVRFKSLKQNRIHPLGIQMHAATAIHQHHPRLALKLEKKRVCTHLWSTQFSHWMHNPWPYLVCTFLRKVDEFYWHGMAWVLFFSKEESESESEIEKN